MLESLGTVLLGLVLIVCAGVVLLGYAMWRESRRKEDMAQAASKPGSGGGGGPKEPA